MSSIAASFSPTSSISINRLVKNSLNKWDELAPLKEQQVKSVLLLSQLNQFQLAYDSDFLSTVDSFSNDDKTQDSSSDDPSQINALHKVIFQIYFTPKYLVIRVIDL